MHTLAPVPRSHCVHCPPCLLACPPPPPQHDAFVRDVLTLLWVGLNATRTGLTLAVLSLPPAVDLMLVRLCNLVSAHAFHGTPTT